MKIITVTTAQNKNISGEFNGISYHPEASCEGVWLDLKNCETGLQFQSFALVHVKMVETNES